jgi:hypothetical protein
VPALHARKPDLSLMLKSLKDSLSHCSLSLPMTRTRATTTTTAATVLVALVATTFSTYGTVLAAGNILDLTASTKSIVFSNVYLSATLDVSGVAYLSSLRGDFQGLSNYGNNLLTDGGVRLERENLDGTISSAAGAGLASKFTVDVNNESCGQVTVDSIVDDVNEPTVSESWVVSLCAQDRSLKITSSGNVLETALSTKLRFVRNAVYATPVSTTGFFDQGVVQILGASADASHFASIDRLQRVFFLGSTGSLDIQRPDAVGGVDDLTVMLNSDTGAVPGAPSYFSGFYDVLVGSVQYKDLWLGASNVNDTLVSCLVVSYLYNCSLSRLRFFHQRAGRRRYSLLPTIKTSPFPRCPPVGWSWIMALTSKVS